MLIMQSKRLINNMELQLKRRVAVQDDGNELNISIVFRLSLPPRFAVE